MITSMSEFQDLFCWYKQNNWFVWAMATAPAAEKLEMNEAWLDTFNERYIHINSNLDQITNFCINSRSTKFKVVPQWNISQMIMNTIPISMRLVTICMMNMYIPFWVWRKFNGNWKNNMIRMSKYRETHSRTDNRVRKINSKG